MVELTPMNRPPTAPTERTCRLTCHRPLSHPISLLPSRDSATADGPQLSVHHSMHIDDRHTAPIRDVTVGEALISGTVTRHGPSDERCLTSSSWHHVGVAFGG